MEKVVIAIPARNSASTLPATLESALSQDYPNFEIIVVDNDSDDDTFETAQKFADRDGRVRIQKFNELVSAEDNFNRCLELAGDNLVLILHADDVIEPSMVSRQVSFLRAHPHVNIVFTHAKTIDEEGAVTGERLLPDELKTGHQHEIDFSKLLKLVLKYGNFLTCPSAMMRASSLLKLTGGWNGEEFGSSADLDLWMRAAAASPIGFITEPLFCYRVSRWSFSVALSKVRTTKHPMFKVLNSVGTQSRQPLSSEDLWNLRFLEAKDEAFIALNRMKKGQTIVQCRQRLRTFDIARAAVTSSFHRRFTVRILAIKFAESFYASRFTKKFVLRLLQRV